MPSLDGSKNISVLEIFVESIFILLLENTSVNAKKYENTS